MKKQVVVIAVVSAFMGGCGSTADMLTSSLASNAGAIMGGGSAGDFSAESLQSQFEINPGLAVSDPLLGAYVTSMISIISAQEIWLSAIGKAELAAELKAQRVSLEGGEEIDGDALESIKLLSTQAESLIAETKAEESTLTSENRATFATGFVPYALGVVQAGKVVKMAPEYASYLKSNALDITRASENLLMANALYDISRTGPGYLQTLYSTSTLVLEYAKDQDIEVPSEFDQLSDIASMSL